MTSSYQKLGFWINSRTELIRSYSTVPASNWAFQFEKETATPGFEPSTLSMTRTMIDALDRSTTTARTNQIVIYAEFFLIIYLCKHENHVK